MAQIPSPSLSKHGPPPIINVTADDLTITGSQPNQIIKVFDANWEFVFQCSGDCPTPVFVDNLTPQVYHIKIDQYDSNWNHVCQLNQDVFPGAAANQRATGNNLKTTNLKLYPNPTYGIFSISTQGLPSTNGWVKVYSSTGQVVKEIQIEDFSQKDLIRFDLRDSSVGLYYVVVQLPSGKVFTERVVVDGH